MSDRGVFSHPVQLDKDSVEVVKDRPLYKGSAIDSKGSVSLGIDRYHPHGFEPALKNPCWRQGGIRHLMISRGCYVQFNCLEEEGIAQLAAAATTDAERKAVAELRPGVALRFCLAPEQPGLIVSVRDPLEAEAISSRVCTRADAQIWDAVTSAPRAELPNAALGGSRTPPGDCEEMREALEGRKGMTVAWMGVAGQGYEAVHTFVIGSPNSTLEDLEKVELEMLNDDAETNWIAFSKIEVVEPHPFWTLGIREGGVAIVTERLSGGRPPLHGAPAPLAVLGAGKSADLVAGNLRARVKVDDIPSGKRVGDVLTVVNAFKRQGGVELTLTDGKREYRLLDLKHFEIFKVASSLGELNSHEIDLLSHPGYDPPKPEKRWSKEQILRFKKAGYMELAPELKIGFRCGSCKFGHKWPGPAWANGRCSNEGITGKTDGSTILSATHGCCNYYQPAGEPAVLGAAPGVIAVLSGREDPYKNWWKLDPPEPTEYTHLFYSKRGVARWRFIDMSDLEMVAEIGPIYKNKGELLAALDVWAPEHGYSKAVGSFDGSKMTEAEYNTLSKNWPHQEQKNRYQTEARVGEPKPKPISLWKWQSDRAGWVFQRRIAYDKAGPELKEMRRPEGGFYIASYEKPVGNPNREEVAVVYADLPSATRLLKEKMKLEPVAADPTYFDGAPVDLDYL